MSSKPGAGINHQEFGVGAEGLVIFLDVGLRYMGFDIRQEPFTVKLTGGPDGGNSGNLIRILIRTYGQHVKLVAIADSSGVAEDPQGLFHGWLDVFIFISFIRFGPAGVTPFSSCNITHY